MKKLIGYVFLVLCFLVWGVIALLPFMEVSNNEMATATTVLIIAGEILFLLAIALLGKEAWVKLKAIFMGKK